MTRHKTPKCAPSASSFLFFFPHCWKFHTLEINALWKLSIHVSTLWNHSALWGVSILWKFSSFFHLWIVSTLLKLSTCGNFHTLQTSHTFIIGPIFLKLRIDVYYPIYPIFFATLPCRTGDRHSARRTFLIICHFAISLPELVHSSLMLALYKCTWVFIEPYPARLATAIAVAPRFSPNSTPICLPIYYKSWL